MFRLNKDKSLLLAWTCVVEDVSDVEFTFKWEDGTDTKQILPIGYGTLGKDRIRKADKEWLKPGAIFWYIIYDQGAARKLIIKFIKRHWTKEELNEANTKAEQLKELLWD